MAAAARRASSGAVDEGRSRTRRRQRGGNVWERVTLTRRNGGRGGVAGHGCPLADSMQIPQMTWRDSIRQDYLFKEGSAGSSHRHVPLGCLPACGRPVLKTHLILPLTRAEGARGGGARKRSFCFHLDLNRFRTTVSRRRLVVHDLGGREAPGISTDESPQSEAGAVVEAADPFSCCCAATSTVMKLMASSYLHRFRSRTTEHGSLPKDHPRQPHYLWFYLADAASDMEELWPSNSFHRRLWGQPEVPKS
ncbi:hypothetical protein BHM03_00012153 [Ensete ventricosum]|nr:hypothetical protein BHM03_00012153 [Ensete ventricosum]